MGYTFRDIPGLTWTEIHTLLLGYIVNKEAEAGGQAVNHRPLSPSDNRKRQHKESIRNRLRAQ